MATKVASIYVLDVRTLSPPSHHLTTATSILSQLLLTKLIAGRKTDVVGLVCVGTRGTRNPSAMMNDQGEPEQYGNITFVGFNPDSFAAGKDILGPPTLHTLSLIQSGFHPDDTREPEDKAQEDLTPCPHGDIIDGVILALHILDVHCKHLKWEKRIYLLTNAAGPPPNMADEEEVKARFHQMNVMFCLIGLNFGPSASNHTIKGEDDQGHEIRTMRANQTALIKWTESLPDGCVYPDHVALAKLEQLRSKQVRSVTSFRGSMTLGDVNNHLSSSLRISLYVYNRVSPLKLPSGRLFSAPGKNNPNKLEAGEVIKTITYVALPATPSTLDEGEGAKATVVEPATTYEREHLLKAFRYGKNLIPFSEEEEEQLSLHSTKCFDILAFVPVDRVPRHYYLSSIMAVLPEPGNSLAGRLFSTLMDTLLDTETAALIRYCRADNSNPKLGVMFCKPKKHYGLFIEMPFADDLRAFQFPAIQHLATKKRTAPDALPHKLDKRTKEPAQVQTIVDQFVDSLDLMDPSLTGMPREAFRPKEVFHPAYHRLYQCITYRALHPNQPNDLPPMDARIMAGISALPQLWDQASVAALKDAFELTKVEAMKASAKDIVKPEAS